jgi:hypothetical protein
MVNVNVRSRGPITGLRWRFRIIIDVPHSLVAQLVEQVTVNHRVGGSSPSQGANIYNKIMLIYCRLIGYRLWIF